jgi:NADH dehydrogenase
MTHRVVIIGGGYAGIPAARRLARRVRGDEVSVSLISAFPDFVERPRLHQLTVGQDIRQVPLHDFLVGSGVEVRIASVVGIDLDGRRVDIVDRQGRPSTIGYDTLVYALGSNIDVASVAGVAEHCTALTGVSSAGRLHTRLADLRDGGGSVTVCGGGLTGMEIVTEIAHAYPELGTRLVSAGTPGGWMAPKARTYLDETFARLGVDVVDGVRVDHVEEGKLVTTHGSTIPFDLCVWAGGFTVPSLARASGLEVATDGRALVDATLESVSHPGVYVIGDAASVSGSWGEQLAMGCRSGGFTGPVVADVIAARLTGRDPKPFTYRYFHECLSLGRQHGLIQFLNADESPKNRILTGRKAIWYKNAVLGSAKVLFRHPGPVFARRRRLVPAAGVQLHALGGA